jgi:hypothetical protein
MATRDAPNHPDQTIDAGKNQSGSNASQPYMTDAVARGGDAANNDQNALDRKMYDENGDPLFSDDYNLAQEHRDREGKGEGRAKDTDLEYTQGGDTSDENGDMIPEKNGAAVDGKDVDNEDKPLDERLSGNQR